MLTKERSRLKRGSVNGQTELRNVLNEICILGYTESIFIVDDKNAFFTSFTFEKESKIDQKEQKRGGGGGVK